MKPTGQAEQAGCGEQPKSRVLRMLQRSFLCNVNDTRALIRARFENPGIACLHYSACSNWSLATYPLFYSSKIILNLTICSDILSWMFCVAHIQYQKSVKRLLGFRYWTKGQDVRQMPQGLGISYLWANGYLTEFRLTQSRDVYFLFPSIFQYKFLLRARIWKN